MSNSVALTVAEVQQFVNKFYLMLDVHPPMIDLLPMVAPEGLEMKFPEATLRSLADFEKWYQWAIRTYFDEVHEVKQCDVTLEGYTAKANIIVKWEASMWTPPAAKSVRVRLDAYQTWTVKRSTETGQPIIVTYNVDGFKYYEGSAML
jgi:hypothetical protein